MWRRGRGGLWPALVLALAGVLAASLGPAGAQVLDTTPPETTITGGPSGKTSDKAPKFSFIANESATFECRFDSEPFGTCSSSTPSPLQRRGPHTFEVRATDQSGNVDTTPAKASFVIVLPPPVLGTAVNIRLVSGSVSVVRRSGRKGLRFVTLKDPRQIAVGSFVDARRGAVRLISAEVPSGHTQSGRFGAGLFQVVQSRKASAKGLTELVLKGSSVRACKAPGSAPAQAAISKRALRRLRANAKGRFRTRGRYAAATVRGTKWTVTDRCDGTLTKVTRGEVAVRDFRRRKTIRVRAGRSYIARAPD